MAVNDSDIISDNQGDDESIKTNITASENFYENHVSRSLWIYGSPIILAIGTVGNILSILVLCRRAIWKLSTSPYFVVLAFADLFVLYSGLLRRWIRHFYDVDIRKLSDAGCRIHVFCVYASLHFSTWILVLVTFGRFLSVCFPLKAKTICSRRKSKMSIAIAFVFIAIVNSHELVFRKLKEVIISNGNITYLDVTCDHATTEYYDFFLNIWPWIDLAISSGIPFSVIIFCNTCIVWKVVISRHFKKEKLARVSVSQDRRISSMTAVLLVINTVFLVTTAPSRIYLIGSPVWHTGVTRHQEAVLLLFWALVNLLMYLNNAINFILYCVSGHQFRNELSDMLCSFRAHVYPIRARPILYPQKTNNNNSTPVVNRPRTGENWTRY